MKTTEGNKLIAEFMGIQIFNNGVQWATFKYHSDWGWLMPVVEKIEQTQPEGFNVVIELRTCYIEFIGITFEGNSQHTKIEAVFNAVCECITWINENK